MDAARPRIVAVGCVRCQLQTRGGHVPKSARSRTVSVCLLTDVNLNPDFDSLLADYGSGVDVPFSIFWKQIFNAFPDSKVILTVRDPERW